MKNSQITFIGGGNMASCLIGGLLADGFPRQKIAVADPDAATRASLRERFGCQVSASSAAFIAAADVVILAVKPQVMRTVVSELPADTPLLLSVAAGVRSGQLQHWLGRQAAIIRAMPNTPALVSSGATALFANEQVSAGQRELAEFILRAVGLTLWLEDETAMDAVTAVSGSGPAYFFYFMEAIEAAGRELGLSAEVAHLLTLQTTLGAARMALESEASVAELRHQVTSPGGTTERALQMLESDAVAEKISAAVRAARARSQELSMMLDEGTS